MLEINSQLERLGLSDCSSSPVRGKVECCRSHDHFGYQVVDCSVTRISSWSIISYHLWPTDSFIRGGKVLSLRQRCSWHILQPQMTGWASIRIILGCIFLWFHGRNSSSLVEIFSLSNIFTRCCTFQSLKNYFIGHILK